MSHYAVAVIHSLNQNIDDMLAPYDENIEVEPYIYRTKDEIIQAGKKTVERYYNNVKQDPEYYTDPERYKWIEPYLKAYKDEDDEAMYLAERDAEYLDENGNELSTYNPKSKWDWYVVGGRFSNMLDVGGGYYSDEAPIRCIYFGADKDEYKACYDWWVEHIDTTDDVEWDSLYKREYYTNRYKDADDYAKRQSSFSTFAVVTPDGEWHEMGSMGWFGVSDETDEDARDWDENYYERFILPAFSQDPNLYITIVDCHI